MGDPRRRGLLRGPPLGLLALGISAGGLAASRWWLLALAAVIACAAVVAHRISGSRNCC